MSLVYLYEGEQPGGQLTITTEIENFPGYPEGISGSAMMEDLKKQAERFGCTVRKGYIKEIDLITRPFRAKDDHGLGIEADTVIIATGIRPRTAEAHSYYGITPYTDMAGDVVAPRLILEATYEGFCAGNRK